MEIAILHLGIIFLILTPVTIAQQPDFFMHKVMSGIQNYTGFCDLMSMSTRTCQKVIDELSEPVDGADAKGEKMVVGATSQIAVFDACNPREQTIALPRHPDPDIMVWPTCTRAMRCGGCCTSEMFSCEPTAIREKFVKVFDTRLPYIGAHRFQLLGIRTVKIVEHVHCDAQCKTKEYDCHKYQKYEARRCRCVCRQERLIHKSSCKENQIWDDNECDCICPNRNTMNCPEPSYFSPVTCKCTLKTTVTGEIDLDKLFAKLDKGLIGSDILSDNQLSGMNTGAVTDAITGLKDVKGKGESEEHVHLEDENEDGVDSGEGKSEINEEQASETGKLITEGGQKAEKEGKDRVDGQKTKSVTTQSKTKSCKSTRCFGTWKPKLLKNGKCQCFPPRMG